MFLIPFLYNTDIVEKDKLFTTAQYQATRGHPCKQFKKSSRLNLLANTFSNRVINTWNNLSANVVNAPSVNAFKNRLNKHWHGHPSKFEATCYQTGHPTSGNRQRYQQASSQVWWLTLMSSIVSYGELFLKTWAEMTRDRNVKFPLKYRQIHLSPFVETDYNLEKVTFTKVKVDCRRILAW